MHPDLSPGPGLPGPSDRPAPGVVLSWIPLGAGGSPVVRASGRVYEAVSAGRERRPRCALVHAALQVRTDDGPEVALEVTPVWGQPTGDRGVVVEGPVGARWLGRSRFFRYEVRCWAGGTVPDLAWATATLRVSDDADVARALLDAAPHVPAHTWGRDVTRTGDMWTSNSVVAWLLGAAGLAPDVLGPPSGLRAPGWTAGAVATGR